MARAKTTTQKVGGKELSVPKKTVVSRKASQKVSTSETKKVQRRRSKPGKVVEREIRKLQGTQNNLLAKSPFVRLVREMTNQHGLMYRFQKQALETIQVATENMLIDIYSTSQLFAEHANRVTLMDKDVKLYLRVFKPKWFKGE